MGTSSRFSKTKLKGAVILAVHHFSYNSSQPLTPQGRPTSLEGAQTLTQEQESYNHELASACAHVENSFGHVVGIFDTEESLA
jgi:hypothetical protein